MNKNYKQSEMDTYIRSHIYETSGKIFANLLTGKTV